MYSKSAFLSYKASDARESHVIVLFNAKNLCNVPISAPLNGSE